MLMNENSELRSLLSCSKNFLKNIINKSIKNNIVLINNDGGCQVEVQAPGFIPSTFGATVTCIKFSLYIKKLILTYTLFKIFITSLIVNKTLILFFVFMCIVFLVVFFIVIRILIQISSSNPISIIFCSSFISFIYISFISFIISSIFTSFISLFILDNTVITI